GGAEAGGVRRRSRPHRRLRRRGGARPDPLAAPTLRRPCPCPQPRPRPPFGGRHGGVDRATGARARAPPAPERRGSGRARMRGPTLRLAFALAPLAVSRSRADDQPKSDLPLACPADGGCIVRNFVDEDPGPGAKDFHCGTLTYDGHKGTDIRVPDGVAMAKGIAVLAAAPGKVLRLRDGMADASIHFTGADAVKDREAGNSVIIDHGNGWETQYGHMRKGSISVKPGDIVAAGHPIGLVGLSGNTEFTHMHFEIRHDGKPVDPYTGEAMGAGCGGAGQPL